ncbi:MAG: GGDEF domain-containing phosphodiesterase [Pseudomonadales bacterium]|nr:GGDEF domain-containing phosphodiesterase [Pseudomonadales bacterium]
MTKKNKLQSQPVPREGVRDSRTQFPNRDSFYYDIAPLIEAGDNSLVLLVIDIEGLNFILRTFGPAERDSVVREIGRRIQEAVGADNTPYYIAQSRFASVLAGDTYMHATHRAHDLVNTLDKPFDVAGIVYHLGGYVGISHFPNHASTLNELVRTGVFACYQARKVETRFATFDKQVDDEERRRFYLMLDLKQALKKQKEILPAYQPQIDLKSGHCIGVESLCRWEHPKHGLIPPGHFLPYVEHSPLIMPLTEMVLGLGLRDLARWNSRGFKGTVAINLSPSLFRHSDLLDRLKEYFRFTNMKMEQVHFEVTETGIMDQPNRAIHTLEAIGACGSKIAVDDFGTGHSSLAYLADLPIHIIKIDMHFVQNLDKHWGQAIVGAAVTLAEKLGLKTIAEGIETEAQLEQCRNLGVDIGQGFYMAKPMFREKFETWVGI